MADDQMIQVVTGKDDKGNDITSEVPRNVYNKIRSDVRLGADIDIKNKIKRFDEYLDGVDYQGQKGNKALESVLGSFASRMDALEKEKQAIQEKGNQASNLDESLQARKAELETEFKQRELDLLNKQKSLEVDGVWERLKSVAIRNGLKQNYYNSFRGLVQDKYNLQIDEQGKTFVLDSEGNVITSNNGPLSIDDLAKNLVSDFPEIHDSAKQWSKPTNGQSLSGIKGDDFKSKSGSSMIQDGIAAEFNLDKYKNQNVIR